jgi:hypothetical protein
MGLPLAGCAADGVETLAAGLVGLAGLFVVLLFALPPVLAYLDRRGHRERMRNRRPWSEKAAERRARRRRGDA